MGPSCFNITASQCTETSMDQMWQNLSYLHLNPRCQTDVELQESKHEVKRVLPQYERNAKPFSVKHTQKSNLVDILQKGAADVSSFFPSSR